MESLMQQTATAARDLQLKLAQAKEAYTVAAQEQNEANARYAAAQRKVYAAVNTIEGIEEELDSLLTQISDMAQTGRMGLGIPVEEL